MPPMLLEFLFATLTAICGLAGGWFIRGLLAQNAPAPQPANKEEAKKTRETLNRLKEMAEGMAVDVGRHNTRVQEINEELTAADAQSPENVMAVVSKVLAANERMQQQLSQAEERLHEQALQIETHVAAARTDPLTGAANRRAFDDQMQRCLAEHLGRGRSFCVLLIDIDHFKKFNDAHGHQAGDHVLKCVTRVLKQQVSKLDMVARYGGEEFAIVFPDTNLAAARPMAERARAAIAAAKISFEGQELRVTASAGLAEIREGESVEALVKRADSALYDSKRAGRNRGHWHDGKVSHLLKAESARPQQAAEAPKRPAAKPHSAVLAAPAANLLGEPPAPQTLRDELTGLSGRETFVEDLLRRVAERKRGGAPVSAMLIRIDRLSELAATHGPGSADQILRAVTQFLKATMREMDYVARYDQDAFGLLLPGAELPDAGRVAERLRGAIERCCLRLPGGECRFTVSIGLTEASRTDSGERVLELANTAMQKAAEAGGNQIFVHTGLRYEPVSREPSLPV